MNIWLVTNIWLSIPGGLESGLPIVIAGAQGFDGYFSDGEVGYSCNPYDTSDIQAAVRKVLGAREALSERARAAARRFEWTSIADEYLRLYRSAGLEKRA